MLGEALDYRPIRETAVHGLEASHDEADGWIPDLPNEVGDNRRNSSSATARDEGVFVSGFGALDSLGAGVTVEGGARGTRKAFQVFHVRMIA